MLISGIVRLTQLANNEELDADDLADLPAGNGGRGSYRDYPITAVVPPGHEPRSESETLEESCLLDEFNRAVAIGCLEHFQQDVLTIKETV